MIQTDRRRWAMLALLAFAQLMLIVDITVVQVALPSIGGDLGLDRAALTWVVTTYTLLFGGLMVLGGRLADVLGARRMLMAGLTVSQRGASVLSSAPRVPGLRDAAAPVRSRSLTWRKDTP